MTSDVLSPLSKFLNFNTNSKKKLVKDSVLIRLEQQERKDMESNGNGVEPGGFSLPINSIASERSRKRRLDHLSLEEKIQRKKLKNRVAAQTSRDRKKAKMDDLETVVDKLKEQNEILMADCASLRVRRDELSAENAALGAGLNGSGGPCVRCSVASSGPAEGVSETPGTEVGRSVNCLPGHGLLDLDTLPPLSEFFDSLDHEECFRQLENLAQSLLQDNGDLEQESKQSGNNVQTTDEIVIKPVGRSEMEEITNMHYNRTSLFENNSNEFTLNTINMEMPEDISNSSSDDPLIGTYDKSSNTLTVVIVDENGVCVEEAPQEEITSLEDSLENNILAPISPASLTSGCLSDCGYESIDSPLSMISGSEFNEPFSTISFTTFGLN